MEELMSEVSRVWNLMKEIELCMMVTSAGKRLRARPMAAQLRENDNEIWFLTDRRGGKDNEVDKDSQVCLAFSDGSKKFVSCSGSITVSNNRDDIEAAWGPWAKAYWPDGPDDPNVLALCFVPEHAEIWEGHGAAAATIKMISAVATGSRPDMGDNTKVRMS
jgi:general stress protein 26